MADSRRGTQLNKFEFEVLQEYFKDRSPDYYDISYQRKVGRHTEYKHIKDRKIRKMVEDGYKLKIDCVAKRKDELDEIIEVKRVADPGAIGQLLSYEVLYEEEFNRSCQLILLCRFIGENIKAVCDYFDIKVIVIE